VSVFFGAGVSNVASAVSGNYEWTTTNILVFTLQLVVAAVAFIFGLFYSYKLISSPKREEEEGEAEEGLEEDLDEDIEEVQIM
jgi:hypothetical protein